MKYFLKTLLLVLVITSCSSDDKDNCVSYEIGNITNVNVPTEATVNEVVEIDVFVSVYNGCGTIKQLAETVNGNSITIEAVAKYDVCSFCTQDAPTRKAIYEFTPETAGEYELKFKSGPNEYITATIQVSP